MAKTRVVNRYRESWEVSIGRPGPFGNPFYLPRGSSLEERAACIAKFKFYFERRVREEPEFRAALETLRGKVLGCYCKPLACHGDVIVEYLEGGSR